MDDLPISCIEELLDIERLAALHRSERICKRQVKESKPQREIQAHELWDNSEPVTSAGNDIS